MQGSGVLRRFWPGLVVVLLAAASAVFLLFALAGFDLAFGPCDGTFSPNAALQRCRMPAYYILGFEICAVAASSLLTFLVVRALVRRIRMKAPRQGTRT